MIDNDNDALNDAQKREKIDPSEEAKALPWFITMTIGALLMWSALYIAETVMTASPEDGDSRAPQVLATKDCAAIDKVAIDGGAIFQGKCVACHQTTGLGITGVFPPLAASEWVSGKPEVLANILLHGINGKLTVKGVAYNGQMPAFKDLLTDGEIAAVLTHIRSQWGNKSEAIDEKLITTVRDATKDRAASYNGDEELSKL
jgi:mono/diheme cytochrome c family protein